MNQRGARETATQTVEAQRLVARDQALREWRRTQDQPLLDYMHHKVQLAHRIDFAVWTKYRDSFDAIRAEHNAGDLADHAPDIYTFQDELLGAAITKLHRNRSP